MRNLTPQSRRKDCPGSGTPCPKERGKWDRQRALGRTEGEPEGGLREVGWGGVSRQDRAGPRRLSYVIIWIRNVKFFRSFKISSISHDS